MSTSAMAEKTTEATLNVAPSFDEPPPPPYHESAPTNPGFCELAFRERHENTIPKGGMTAAEYFLPCKACGFVCGDEIPQIYKQGWLDWTDPSVNFRWESHVCVEKKEGEPRKEMFSCWICWEFEQKWVEPMGVFQWYKHIRRHFFVEGYRICKGKTGAMRRRRNCELKSCPKIHS